MKIVYWNSGAFGGAGTYERELIKGLSNMPGLEIVKDVAPLRMGKLSSLLTYRTRKGADIIHATTQTVSIPSLFRDLKDTKLVVTVHDLHHLLYFSLSAEYFLKRLFVSKSLQRADKLITVSNFYRNEIVRLLAISQKQIRVVPLGIDHFRFKPLDETESRTKLGLDKSSKYILVVATTSPPKRMDITRKTFEAIIAERCDIYLLKVGGGKLIGKKIMNMGRVPYWEMPLFYNASDVLLHTSEYESFGMPLLEAMACGVPIVASDKASIPEVVGDSGELVDLDSEDCVEQFAEKVLDCIDKEERNKKGIERSKEFSWERTAKETIRVYEELILP